MAVKGTSKPVHMRDIEKTIRDIISDYPSHGMGRVGRDRRKSVPVCAMIQAVNASKQWASPAPPFWEDKWWATDRAALNYGSKAATVYAIGKRLMARRRSISSFQRWLLYLKLEDVYTVAHNSRIGHDSGEWVVIDGVCMGTDTKAMFRIRQCLLRAYGQHQHTPLGLIFDERLTFLIATLGLAYAATNDQTGIYA
jgi:hypothetical protein